MIDLFRPPWLPIRIASCRSPRRVFRRTVLSQFAKLATSPQRRQRQYVCGVEAEDPHAYSRRVYFPVELRSVFRNGRYVVLHKLGWGGYATVWLARDTLSDSNVALKIIHKDVGTHELEIMRHLRDSPIAHANIAHPGRKYVVQLLDDFDVSTSHNCLVLDVMGRSIASRAEEYTGGRLPGSIAREVTHQVALGLDYLWKCRVAHGDLYGGNVLFAAPTISAMAEERLKSYLGDPELGAVKRLDGGPLAEPSVPRYLVLPRTFRGCDAEIRIADLGAAYLHDTPPGTLHTPIHMRAPEALFEQPLSPFVDMWSMGCLLFETVTGRSFISSMFADRWSTMEEIQSYIGPPPVDWIDKLGDTVRERINEVGLRNIELDRYLRLAYDQDDAALIEEDEDDYPIEEYEKAKLEFTDAELDALSLTVSGLLTYDPALRNTPDALLRSPWFRG
ncbi:kinase-like protein [Melanomma pulvis-pyrius CBS 109.77]|uniref:Kinase-like protein n=1 Tax=Melanomma pulvis-pyrius CBS 109.77 TaxID=1314802 RepID=A0A6A6WNX3_9PLEO|nr:kinase-like protein [Melanomma pulvis-pyrius CBS 109.77]